MPESERGVAPDGMKKRDEDSDDGVEFSPFWGIEKGAVLQEARCFNESQLDPRRCQQVITKLLYLLNQGETFTKVSETRVTGNDRGIARARRPIIPLDSVTKHASTSVCAKKRAKRPRFFLERFDPSSSRVRR
jgi:hypothetical protein